MPAKPLNQVSGMPQMSAAFAGWMMPITIGFVTQTVASTGFVTQAVENITFRGTIQPLSPEEIELKPDGQRSWEWLQIHCLQGSLNLKTNDIIVFNLIKYKVMAVKDYSLNNYIEYHVVKDYQN
jgi:hypothetical protein